MLLSLRNPFPDLQNNDLYMENPGSDYILLCCSQLVSYANNIGLTNWDGTLYIRVVASSPYTEAKVYYESAWPYYKHYFSLTLTILILMHRFNVAEYRKVLERGRDGGGVWHADCTYYKRNSH